MTRRRRRIFWFAGGLGIVVLLPLLLLAAANTRPGLAVVENLINRSLSDEARLTGLSGRLPDRPVVDRVELRDPDGVWLWAEDVRLDWSPTALLRGRLDIGDMRVARVNVERQPSPTSAADAEPVDLTTLLPPVDVAVAALSVPLIVVRPDVLELAAELSLDAALDLPRDGRAIAVKTSLRRLDAPARADILLTHDAVANRLTLDVAAEEPAGGLLARLLDLPGLPAVRLTANGDGPLDDLTLTLDASAGDIAAARARLTLTRIAEGLRVRLDGDAEIAVVLPAVYRPLTGPKVSFAAELLRFDDGPIEIDSVRIETDAVRAEASGRVDPAGNRLSGRAELTGDLVPLSALAEVPLQGGFDVQATIAGDLTALTVDYVVSAEDIGVDTLAARTFRTEGKANYDEANAGQIGLSGRAETVGVVLDGVPLPVVGGDATGDYEIEIQAGDVRIRSLTATAGPVAATTSGRISGDGVLDLALTAEVGDIAALGLADLPGLSGQTRATARLSGPVDGEIALALDGDMQRFASGVVAVDDLAGERIGYRVTARYAAADGLRVDNLRVAAGPVTLTGNAALNAVFADLTADLAVAVADLTPLTSSLGVEISGSVAGKARLRGDPADPAVAASAEWRQARFADVADATISVAADLQRAVSAPAGDIRLSAAWRDLAADVRTALRLDNDVLVVSGLEVRGDDVSADADLRIDMATGLITGPLSAAVPRLQVFSTLAGFNLGGSAEIAATLATDAGVQTLSGEVTAASLRLDDLSAAGLQISATLRQPFDAPAGDVQAVVWDIDAGGQRLQDVGLGAALTANALDFNLRITGPEDLNTALEAGGAVGWQDLALDVVLERLYGRLAGEPLRLATPVKLSRTETSIAVTGLDLGIGAGRVHGDLELGAERVAGDIAVEALAVEPFAALAGGPAILGTATARLRLAGTPTAPDVTADLRLADLTVADQAVAADIPPIAFAAQATWRDGEIAMRAGVEGVDGLTADVEGRLPLRGDLSTYRFDLPETEPLNVSLTIDGDIERISPLLPLDGHSLAGRFAGQIALDGTLARLKVDGKGGLTNGFYANDASGFVLRDIGLQLAGDERRLLLQKLTANDDNGGRLDGDGAVTFGEDGLGAIDVAVDLTTLSIARIDEVHATTSGALRLAGPFRDLLLSGTLTVDKADIEIPSKLPVSVSSIEVTEINLPAERQTEAVAPATGAQTDVSDGDVRLEVKIDLPGQVFVRGRGLDSEWRGGFDVGGWLSRPAVNGQLEIVRGTFALAGRSFEFQRGVIDVSTTKRGNVDAELDLRAAAQAGDITAEVLIDGPVLSPEVTLQSTPALPQDEILARVLFGKNVGSLSAVQAFQLGQSALVLSGKLSSGGIVSDIRRSLGLDALDIESGEGSGVESATLKAGKYVTDNVYLGMRQGLTAQSSRAVLEYKVLPWLSLESSVGATADSDIGVTLERRY